MTPPRVGRTIRVRIDRGPTTGTVPGTGPRGNPAANRAGIARPSASGPLMRVDRRPGVGAVATGAGRPCWRAPRLLGRAPLPADPRECPPLPSDARTALEDGLAALGLDDLPAQAVADLEGHLRLLLAWTGAVNLTAIRDPLAAVAAHVLDSLAALPLLRASGVGELLDLGSGGGYPGLPLAITLPARRALLVDSIAKKARFLATTVAALGLAAPVEVAAVRAESLAADPHHRERWAAVTARAVASLPDLVEIAFPLLAVGGVLVAWKRTGIDEETRRAMPALVALGGGTLELIETRAPVPAGHVLVACRKAGRTPAGWPRPPAERARHPW